MMILLAIAEAAYKVVTNSILCIIGCIVVYYEDAHSI